MKFVLFGVGARGKALLNFLGKNRVVAFVDNNEFLLHKTYSDIPIISLSEYEQKYSEFIIDVTPIIDKQILLQIHCRNINKVLQLKECPDGFYDYSYDFMMNRILNSVSIHECNIVHLYGLNLFSILIYDYLSYKGYDVKIILNDNNRSNRVLLHYLSKKYNFIEYEHIHDKDKTIYLTYPINEEEKNKLIKLYHKLDRLYDFEDMSNIMINENIRQFKNKHIGQRCFVVATGPSLKISDLETLKNHNELSISMNSIYKGFQKTSWRPKYYLATDPKTDYLMKAIDEMDVPYKFVADRAGNFWKHNHENNVFKLHVKYVENGRELKFSEDLTKCVYSAGNVTYNCLQLAVYLGCKEIYLIGVDFSNIQYEKGKKTHFVENYNDDLQLYKDKYIGEGLISDDEAVQWQGRTYISAKKYTEEHGIKIFNATRGGKLEIFQRVDFDSLFDKKKM